MDIYEVPALPGRRRYLMRFSGMLDPTAFDVWFLLWNRGRGEMVALIDAPTAPEALVRLKKCALVQGEAACEETSESIDDICRRLDLPHPLASVEDQEMAAS